MCTNGQLDNTDGVFAPYKSFVELLFRHIFYAKFEKIFQPTKLDDNTSEFYVKAVGKVVFWWYVSGHITNIRQFE